MKANLSTILMSVRLTTGRWFVATVLLWAAGVRAAESTFTNVTDTVAPGLSAGGKSAAAWADYDNDGRLDLLFTGLFSTTNGNTRSTTLVPHLWRNNGSGFTDVTATLAPGLPAFNSVTWS